jgi:hypothetical protein
MRASLKLPIAIACAWIVPCCVGGLVAHSEQPEPPAAGAEARKTAWLHEVYLRDASEYEFFFDLEKTEKLELRREPVMRYTGDFDHSHGEVYVWTHQGRPALVGCIFSQPVDERQRRIMHEFHSLALKPLVAGQPGSSGWRADETGIALEIIPNVPVPAQNEAVRLAQMRALARRFSAHMTRQDSQRDELRLLPQPLYRYEPAGDDSPVVDGALFAYVWTVSTDPEVVLVLEARRNGGEVRWEFALARLTSRGAWATYEKRVIWRVAATKYDSPGMKLKPYGLFLVKRIANQPDP